MCPNAFVYGQLDWMVGAYPQAFCDDERGSATHRPRMTEIGSYILDRYLGEGSSGTVFLARHRATSQPAAVKVVSKAKLLENSDLQDKLNREITLLAFFDHPHVIGLIDVEETDEYISIVMEYADGGELLDCLVTRGFITEVQAAEFIRQIALGLEYLHIQGICHRDLKPENMLLDRAHQIKIADFGFARWTTAGYIPKCEGSGSLHYIAPEALTGEPYDGMAADIWSIGVVLFLLLARYLPFDDQLPSKLTEKVKAGSFMMPEFSTHARDLVGRMLQRCPEKRITIQELKEHPFIRLGVPGGYVFPVPLPVLVVERERDVYEKDAKHPILKKFWHAGEKEFVQTLIDDQRGAKYVTIVMMSENVDFDSLSWEGGEVADEEDGPPKWIVVGRSSDNTTESVVFQSTSSCWDIANNIQHELRDVGMRWLHPDETYVVFSSADSHTNGWIVCEFQSERLLTVKFSRRRGDDAVFKQIVKQIIDASK